SHPLPRRRFTTQLWRTKTDAVVGSVTRRAVLRRNRRLPRAEREVDVRCSRISVSKNSASKNSSDHGNQKLPKVRGENPFRRAERALHGVRARSGGGSRAGFCSRGRGPRPGGEGVTRCCGGY